MARASAWPSVVLPTPGTPSISRCPLAKTETKAMRRTSSLPRMTRRSADSSSAARRALADNVSGGIRLDSTMGSELDAVTGVIRTSEYGEERRGPFGFAQDDRDESTPDNFN